MNALKGNMIHIPHSFNESLHQNRKMTNEEKECFIFVIISLNEIYIYISFQTNEILYITSVRQGGIRRK